jgi:hypothetical protein
MLGVSNNAETFRGEAARDIEGYAIATQAMTRRYDRSRNYLKHVSALPSMWITRRARQTSVSGAIPSSRQRTHFYRTMTNSEAPIRRSTSSMTARSLAVADRED